MNPVEIAGSTLPCSPGAFATRPTVKEKITASKLLTDGVATAESFNGGTGLSQSDKDHL